jgi:hypothetical protein
MDHEDKDGLALCLAKDAQEAMEWLNNIGVAYLDAGEIAIAKAFFVQALRLKAQTSAAAVVATTSPTTSTLRRAVSAAHCASQSATSPATTIRISPSIATATSNNINITALATRTVTAAAKRGGRHCATTPTGKSKTLKVTQTVNKATVLDRHPFLHDRALAFFRPPSRSIGSWRHNNPLDPAPATSNEESSTFSSTTTTSSSSSSDSPLVSTAMVIFNLGLVHHILGLMDASQHREMTHRAQLLYEESMSLLDLHLWNVKGGQEYPLGKTTTSAASFPPSPSPHVELLLMATYNNLAHVAFEMGNYEACATLMDQLRPLVSDAAIVDFRHGCKRKFLLNSLLLFAPTVAAVA